MFEEFNCNVKFIDMPTTIKAFVRKDIDDFYTIIVNSRLDYSNQMKCIVHEMNHIRHCDFEKSNADKIENEAHKKGMDL